jgi:hypothetical protein
LFKLSKIRKNKGIIINESGRKGKSYVVESSGSSEDVDE